MSGPMKLQLRVQPLACVRCLLRQNIRSSELQRSPRRRWTSSYTRSATSPGSFSPTSQLSKKGYAHLSNRAIIRLRGPDVLDFLNGLLPAKLDPSTENNYAPIFTAFLSAKGRILYEAFVYLPRDVDAEAEWYIDVDEGSAAALFSHLKKHKLRSKFKLEKISAEELAVYYMWPRQENAEIGVTEKGGQDPRPLMGTRFLSKFSEPSPLLSKLQDSGTPLTLDEYHIHRIISGHAEGPTELITNSALPQESNIDFDNGIDFHKGCYLGQELTIRTHHTGVVRKRILPCQIFPSDQTLSNSQEHAVYDSSVPVHQPPSEANISKMHARGRAGRSTGKWLGGVGNIGLALCRLEVMTDIQLTAEGSSFDPRGEFAITWEEDDAANEGKATLREVKVKPFVPRWVRDKIQAGIQARSDRSKRRQPVEDDEDEVD